MLSFVQTTSFQLNPASSHLPTPVAMSLTAFTKIHYIWRWIRIKEYASQNDTFSQFLTGYLARIAINQPFYIRLSAQLLFVATRLHDCALQQAELSQTTQKWIQTVKGQHLPLIHYQWEKKSIAKGILSPSTINWIKLSLQVIWQRVHRLALLSLNLATQIFKLSMLMLDVVDEIHLIFTQPGSSVTAMNESFLTLTKSIKIINENKEQLLIDLNKNQLLIERLIDQTPITFSDLQDHVKTAVDCITTVHKSCDRISNLADGTFLEVGKSIARRSLNSLMIVGSLSRYRPAWLIEQSIAFKNLKKNEFI